MVLDLNNKDKKFENFKSGFVAIAGAPNVGKSTLLNRMLCEKISITSQKPQTTRNRILGVVHRQTSQLVFLDTPGMHRAKSKLNERIVDVAVSTLSDVDIILFVVNPYAPDPELQDFLVRQVSKQKKPVLLAVNKIDIVKKPLLLAVMDTWKEAYEFQSIIPVSAKTGTQVDNLLTTMESLLPLSPPLYPKETLTDLSERFIAAEMIREKVFRLTGQEIPYSTAVTIDTYSENSKRSFVKISASINVERDSQKGIIIGKNGSKLKKIGQDARKEIERMLNAKVYLKLFVRVQKNWSSDTKALRQFGY